MKKWASPSIVVILGAFVAGACSPLGPIPDRSRYYTLMPPPVESADSDTRREPSTIVYGLGPVTLPAYLDRSQVATRLSATEVAYSQWDRWAEPLGANIAWVLRQSLVEELRADDIVAYPWTGASVDYQVEVRLLCFETDVKGETRLVARWSVRDARHDRLIVRKETSLTRAGKPDDRAGSTAALSATLGELGHEIAAALRDLPPTAAAPTARPAATSRHRSK
jgi:uncharacterized protein